MPVPLHPAKQRERGFNQAEGLALRLGRATRIPVDRRLLRRVVPTQTQTQLSRAARTANVRDAFALRPNRELAPGRRVVLVDDVLTTGATHERVRGGAPLRGRRGSLRVDRGARALRNWNDPLTGMTTTTFTKKTLGHEPAEPAVTPPVVAGETKFVKKPRPAGGKSKKRDIPEGLWTKCEKCRSWSSTRSWTRT